MCVQAISAVNFKAGKIELEAIDKKDLSNYDNLKLLAQKKYCDFLIEKKHNHKYAPDYNVFLILARIKGINSKYIFTREAVTLHKNTTKEKVLENIYDASVKAANSAKEAILNLAKSYIKK